MCHRDWASEKKYKYKYCTNLYWTPKSHSTGGGIALPSSPLAAVAVVASTGSAVAAEAAAAGEEVGADDEAGVEVVAVDAAAGAVHSALHILVQTRGGEDDRVREGQRSG